MNVKEMKCLMNLRLQLLLALLDERRVLVPEESLAGKSGNAIGVSVILSIVWMVRRGTFADFAVIIKGTQPGVNLLQPHMFMQLPDFPVPALDFPRADHLPSFAGRPEHRCSTPCDPPRVVRVNTAEKLYWTILDMPQFRISSCLYVHDPIDEVDLETRKSLSSFRSMPCQHASSHV